MYVYQYVSFQSNLHLFPRFTSYARQPCTSEC